MIPIDDRVGLRPELRAALESELSGYHTLQDAVLAALIRPAPGSAAAPGASPIVDVVVQDEYTHDVVFAWCDGLYLVYDAT